MTEDAGEMPPGGSRIERHPTRPREFEFGGGGDPDRRPAARSRRSSRWG